ncbi:FAD dependent oxidoreductase [Aspergillus karnatakaensis]|uniref:NAD(P)/FAD-dependent oxidoreductase n=1 Tax=Aspergillus karnatakaensis TaxID=1810916 RepID=UPI003CCCD0B2
MSLHNNKTQSILILGAGCFGLSTAYHLACQGYTRITVLEKDSNVPSRFSAANDLNKVIRAEYADPFYTDLALEAIRKWQTDPLYSPHYHQTGFLNVTSKAATDGTKQVIEKYYASIQNHSGFDGQVQRVRGASGIKKLVPAFGGPVDGWSGYYNKLAGYSHSANTLKFVYEACLKKGINFHLGESEGEVESLLYTSARAGTVCIGAKTRGGNLHLADKTILALGADVPNLIPDIGKQVVGRCWGVAHIQLTADEAKELEGIPVTNVRDLAFFFEPDRETKKLKFCHMGGAFTNYAWSKDGLSLPYSSIEESQFIPANDERCIRQLLRELWPHLADRPLIDKHLCWVADTDDSDYIIDFVPGTGTSLVVLSGDSGHGFKMMPIFGKFVQTLLEEGKQAQSKWQWKTSKPQAASAWRSGESQELAGLVRSKL